MHNNRNRRSLKPKVIIGAVIAILLVVAAIGITTTRSKQSVTSTKQPAAATAKTNSPDAISMLLTGDWIAHDSVNAAAKQTDGSYDYLPLVSAYQPIFKQTDIKFCNDPILNSGAALGITGYPKFNSPTSFVTDMGKLGCNLVNTASNHSFDFTQANITASVDAWKQVPAMLSVAGQNSSQQQHDTINYFTVKGVKFAFLAYTAYSNSPPQNSYGVNEYNEQRAAAQIKEAKQSGAAVVIVSMRWGVEYSPDISKAQDTAAQYLADQGANLVLGHGPHVLQSVQELSGAAGNKTLVWYSLGNFLNTQIPPETVFGVPLLSISTETKDISIKGFLPFYMHYSWTAAQAKAENTNARKDVKMYLLENATQSLIDAQQLNTTVDEQKAYMQKVLSGRGVKVLLLNSSQL